MAHILYENFYLSNEVEDGLNSHLDLTKFCTIDKTLVGHAGMKRIINRYKAVGETENLTKGQGNSKAIEVSFEPVEYEIKLAQNKFPYYDEEEMQDPMIVPVGMKGAAESMFNKNMADVFAEFSKTTNEVPVSALNFDAFVDAVAAMNIESLTHEGIFAFVCPLDVAEIRKELKDTLQYVKEFATSGYIGTVNNVNLYVKKNTVEGEVIVATKEAVRLLIKKGIETEQKRDADTRYNEIFSREYYVAALENENFCVKIKKSA